ncbi:MAG: YIP1 family protein [Candidatus Rokuibacteriota bacterium]
MEPATTGTGFIERLLRAARLDRRAYAGVETDARATPQAALVVALSALAAGVGAGGHSLLAMGLGALGALVAWYLWAALVYWIGARLLPEPGTSASHGELLRTVGFASAPGLIRLLGLIPELRTAVFLIAGVWMLATTVVAVREALDYRSLWRAIGVTALGWAVQIALLAGVMWLVGAPGGGA